MAAEVEDVKALKERITELEELTAMLESLLQVATKPGAKPGQAHASFKLEGITYDIIRAKVSYKGREYTAEQIASDAKLQAELIKIKATCITINSK